jgi:nucleotide-binding universal stress UspA family protein
MERLVRNNPLGPKLSSHIVVGDPAERIIEHARAIGGDLLVTGPAYGKRPGDRLLGSTASRIVRHASQPVLAVRRRQEGPYAAVIAGVDFSPQSRAAVLCGRNLFPEAQFTLIHAYQVTPDWSGHNEDKPLDEVEADERSRVVRAAEQDMADFLVGLDQSGGKLGTLLLQGTPEVVLGDYVDKNWPDLVVAGTHGRTGPQQANIGSVAEQLLNTLPCDVLAVPTRG